ncbi:hypothetical protein TA3x_005803 (plasmid) [Tundrisphaera sp. TA3]|uniref:hypothetical protein n=1 Tax=Tundrisphaera sp. TA3 TaxID=3435775 RepID=UPI003EBDD4D4
MAWKWLSLLIQNRKQAHEAIFDLDQGVIAEQRASSALKDLAEVAEANLETLNQVAEFSKKFEGGDQVVAAAALAYREGLAALVATPTHLFPTDPEARREVMQRPSMGSTISRPMPVSGPQGGSGQVEALPDASSSHQADNQARTKPQPKKPKGRPKGSRNKPKSSPLPDTDTGQGEAQS